MTGRCQTRSGFRASCPRDEWPTTCSWHPGKREHPPRIAGLCLGNIPTRLEAFPTLLFSAQHAPPAVDCSRSIVAIAPRIPVPSLRKIADTVGNAVTFLRLALCQTTLTLFSSQGTTSIFCQRRAKVERQSEQRLYPRTPNHGLLRGEACGGLKPFDVILVASQNYHFRGPDQASTKSSE